MTLSDGDQLIQQVAPTESDQGNVALQQGIPLDTAAELTVRPARDVDTIVSENLTLQIDQRSNQPEPPPRQPERAFQWTNRQLPIDEGGAPEFFAMAFPVLFPNGKDDWTRGPTNSRWACRLSLTSDAFSRRPRRLP